MLTVFACVVDIQTFSVLAFDHIQVKPCIHYSCAKHSQQNRPAEDEILHPV